MFILIFKARTCLNFPIKIVIYIFLYVEQILCKTSITNINININKIYTQIDYRLTTLTSLPSSMTVINGHPFNNEILFFMINI